jgi:glycosyltransferase involved in cell wall biosynthesis
MPGSRVLIVQYAGDFREARQRLQKKGTETYYGQRYSIEAVEQIATYADEVATLSGITDGQHNEVVAPGVRSIGAGFAGGFDSAALLRMVQAYKPTHLILRTPNKTILTWAIANRVRTLLTLADSFQGGGLRSFFSTRSLVKLLNNPIVEWVGNHGWNASRNLVRIGVKKDKVVPWDWPHNRSPADFAAKTVPPGSTQIQLLYVGLLTESKGLGDVLQALARLKASGRDVSLVVVGKGDTTHFAVEAERLGVGDRTDFRGLISNSEIVPLMRASGAVIIPSRHDYPEGFPMTIYEALISRSPIIASDHPMFRGILRDRQSALVFPAGDAAALAERVDSLFSSEAMYASLSKAALDTWNELDIPIAWGELAQRWVRDSPTEFQAWLLFSGIGGVITEKL